VIENLAESLNITRVQSQFVVTLGVVVGLAIVRLIILSIVHRRIEDPAIWYRTRKLLSYLITVIGFMVLASIWLEGSGIATYIGLLTAGLAIALSDVLKNLAGWLFIVTRRPFRLGDRIEIAGRRGDVIDIRAFRFSLLEIENRVDAEQSTGRLLHVPNGLTFTEPLANYTEGFPFIWHEVPVLITFESDWEAAEQIILEAVQTASPESQTAAAMKALRETATEYRLSFTHLRPTVYLTVKDSGVLLTGRFLVDPRKLRGTEQDVWKTILRAFAGRDDLSLAYPTIRTHFEYPVQIHRPDQAPDA
jgi:small-conductance mechanosensitive channel